MAELLLSAVAGACTVGCGAAATVASGEVYGSGQRSCKAASRHHVGSDGRRVHRCSGSELGSLSWLYYVEVSPVYSSIDASHRS